MMHALRVCVAASIWIAACGMSTLAQTDRMAVHDTALVVEPPPSLGPRLSRIATIFVDQCVGCHNDQQAQGGYSMATPDSLRRPGESKRPPIARDPNVPVDQGWGELYRRLVSAHPDERMPKDADPLDADRLDAIYEWLAFGAKMDGASDAPIESFVPSQLDMEPRWPSYPKPHAVTALAFDDTGEVIFSSGAGEILVWSLNGHRLARIPMRGRFVSDIEWNASNSSLYAASGTPGQIGYVESVPWSRDTAQTHEPARLVHWVARDVPLDFALSSDGARLAVGLHDGTVLVQPSSSTTVIWKAATHAAAVTSMDWSHDGKFLFTSSRDRTAKSLEASSGDVVTSFVNHERTVSSARGLLNGCVTMDESGALRLFPGGTASNAAASRTGFAQRTPKLASDRERVLVPIEGAVLPFDVRSQEVAFKDKEGNDQKKTEWMFDEAPRWTWNGSTDSGPAASGSAASGPAASGSSRETPLSLALGPGRPVRVAAGLADGRILVWTDDPTRPVSFLNVVP